MDGYSMNFPCSEDADESREFVKSENGGSNYPGKPRETFSKQEKQNLEQDGQNNQTEEKYSPEQQKQLLQFCENSESNVAFRFTNKEDPKSNTFHPDNKQPKDFEIRTLGHAIKYFNLTSDLRNLEESLENVRKRKKSIEQHKLHFKELNKKIQKQSVSYHPDRVKNRGGSDEAMAIAQQQQAALNLTRATLNALNELFLQDVDTDHKYDFYMKLSVITLGDEGEMKRRVSEVSSKLAYLSEIKRQDIILEIQKFLSESRACVKCYFERKEDEFKRRRDLAMFCLNKCIKGYEKLNAEFNAVVEECKEEKLDNITPSLKKMAYESSRALEILRQLKKFAKKLLGGRCRFYCPFEEVDDYFVLPFVCYVNVIIMCNAMFKNKNQSMWQCQFFYCYEELDNFEIPFLIEPYYLASVFCGYGEYEEKVNLKNSGRRNRREVIKVEFRKELEQASNVLLKMFRVENYHVEKRQANDFKEDYLKMEADFKKKEEEFEHRIEELIKRRKDIEEMFKKAMKDSEEYFQENKLPRMEASPSINFEQIMPEL